MSEPELSPITYADFVNDVIALADALDRDGWRPEYIVGIGRGGLVPGAYLSHRTGIALLSVDHSSGVPDFAEDLLAKLAAATRDGRQILLVDDMNDSGLTIDTLRGVFVSQGGILSNLRVAVLIENIRSSARVEYRARTIDRADDKRWFVFPWEAMAERATLLEEAGEVPERLA